MISEFPRWNRSVGRAVDCVVIGAGHAGLAMSHCLAASGIDHVILERGEVANSWRRERWDSLRLLTPNWLSRLPGYRYDGDDPDGFMTMPEVIDFIEGYAKSMSAPVSTGTSVLSVTSRGDGYRVATDQGDWDCRAVVLASGAHNVPNIPALSESVPSSVAMYTPHDYRNPDQLEDRGVLVVGASATGLQLASEIRLSGRPVTLAVGEHVRMPRTYRGMDIQWWMHAAGILDQGIDDVDDIVRARHVPSPQLVGTPERSTLDLNVLTDMGVEVVGRLAAINDGKALFSGALRNHCAAADLKLGRLLDAFDEWAAETGIAGTVEPPWRPEPTHLDDSPRLSLDIAGGGIGSVIWATGFRPDYSWLDVPVFDRKGRLRHDGGVVDAPGMYVMALNFMRRRKSSFIHGAEDDARELCAHLRSYLDKAARPRTVRAVG